jgi:PAS domain S-box-containing protein
MNNNKVLLIEDDGESVFLLKKLLERIGYQSDNIKVCNTLQEINSVNEEDFSVILLDLTLPDSPFDKTFERVYTNFPRIPIIVLTGKDEDEFANKTIFQGAQDYLIKGTFGIDLLQKSMHYAVERNKIRSELQRSQADYKRVFEESPTPMFVFDRNTYRILEVNIATIRQYGYTKEELLSRTMDDIRPVEDIEAFHDILHTLTDKYTDAGQWRHLNSDGTTKHVHIYSHKTRFNDIDAIITMAINVDEKVRAKERLKERNKEITDILDSITDGFYTINHDWVITYVNSAFEEIFGIKKENAVGRMMWDVFPIFYGTDMHKEFTRTMESGKVYQTTALSQAANKWLQISVYPVKDGLAIYLLNINEEYQLNERLINNDKALRAIINNTDDIIWSIDRYLKIIEANQPFWDTMKAKTGKDENEIQAGDIDTGIFRAWQQYFDRAFNGENFKTIWTEETENGTAYAEVSFNPIYDNENNITAISCFSRNITAEKLYQNKIEQQNRQLREIAWLQSHKVRSQVATILGLSQFINQQIIADPDLSKVLSGIEDAAKELDTVIKDINSLTTSVDG